MNVRKAEIEDIEIISKIYEACFPKELNHRLWIEASFNSFPRGVYYVIEQDCIVVGYILWCVKNGFRNGTIAELEQIGIHPMYSGNGFGRSLIESSISKFKLHVESLGHAISSLMVTTSEGNFAESLYISTLGVSRSAVVTGYGSGSEVILYNNSFN